MRKGSCFAPIFSCIVVILAATPVPSYGQSVEDMLRRAAERAAEKALRKAAPQEASQPPASPTPAAPAAAAVPDVPGGPGVQGLETPLGDAPRVLDLRNGTPPELKYRFLMDGSRIIVSNPYVPVDRRFIERAHAMACHPQGGLVIAAMSDRYAPSPERGEDRTYVPNGEGLWRVETDGRVRPLFVQSGRGTSEFRLCNVAQTRAVGVHPSMARIAIDPAGQVVVADASLGVVRRFRNDGYVEHVAGGGPRVCQIELGRDYPERGYRDGPGSEALFGGEISIAVNGSGEIFVTENDITGSRAPGNCSLRRIGPDGRVSTIHGNGKCPPHEDVAREGYRTPAFDRVAIDPLGRPLVMGATRASREGSGPDVVYTKVHRIDQGRAELLGRAGHGARFDPAGRLVAVGLAPDGTPLAFNAGYYSDAGLVVLENRPTPSYWWRAASGMHRSIDGPRGEAIIDNAKDFCAATDGYMYVLTERTVRRIDPKSGEVTTWLQ